MKVLCFVIILALPLVANAKTTTVKTVDANGAPFPRVLIIVKSLEGGGEIARYLTDQDGRTPGIQFGSGLCRVIAMCPYGLCHTTIQEYLGSGLSAELVLPVSINPTDLYGEIVGRTRVHLLLTADHGKASGLRILVRDSEARWENWYVTTAEGSADIELPTDPSVIVAIYHEKVFTWQVSKPKPVLALTLKE